ncbi:efflux RND transporter periplasmic adaptor subunit [Tabrizicola flagellatus]|uniref:efflux RND transporter periplasmic adaptor subunit n=1 Tax=Tabrizicola flagellatus TaxID=2593021 RepID=UPI0011F2A620|nr:efflux RND transporter periplasmic adaptor subunit [Tabrizicola flagellatus]
MRPTLILAAALTLIGPALPALAEGTAAAQAASAPTAAPALPAITVAEVATRRLTDRVIASGLIAAVEEVQVAPLVEGQPLDRLLADVGDTVAEGQVLAVLSRTTLDLQRAEAAASLAAARSAIAQAEAQLVEAEAAAAEAARAVERTAKLRQSGTAPQATWDTVQANATAANARVTVARQGLESARAQLALAEARLENVDLMLSRTEVKAPVAGKIVARNAKIGAIATAAGQPMFVIVRDSALELRADVSETDLLRLVPGQKAHLRAVGMAGTLEGTVRLVEPAIDPVTRLGRARIAVDQAGELRTGMFVEAEIIAAERDGLAVPVTAIGASPEGTSVMRVRDGVVERVAVTTGIRDGGMVEIVSGLQAGDQVVLKAGAFVRAGDRINPVLSPVPGN